MYCKLKSSVPCLFSCRYILFRSSKPTFPRPDRALACTNSSSLLCGNICCCKGTEKGKTFKIKRYGNETPHRKTSCPNDCDAHQEPMCHACAMHRRQRLRHHGLMVVQLHRPYAPQTVAKQPPPQLKGVETVTPCGSCHLAARSR